MHFFNGFTSKIIKEANKEVQKIINQNKNYIVNDLEKKLIFKKFMMWREFLNKTISDYPTNPNIHALVFTTKISIMCGILESIINKVLDSKNKFKTAMKNLNIDEKFLFAQNILLTKDEQYKNYSEKLVDLYLKNKIAEFEKEFELRLDYFYGARSNLIHKGEWPFSAILKGSSEPLFFLTKSKPTLKSIEINIKILEKYINLDESVLRAILRTWNINIPYQSISLRIKYFLLQTDFATKREYFELFNKKFK